MNSVRVPCIFCVISVILHDFCDFRAISDRIPVEFRVISVFLRGREVAPDAGTTGAP